jgi:uncharacterized protein DUF3551
MKTMFKMAAMSAVVFSTFALVGTVGSGAAMAAELDGAPNDAYCLSNTESGSWCGYSTFSQCEQSASGTGGDCVGNVTRDEDRPAHRHTAVIR